MSVRNKDKSYIYGSSTSPYIVSPSQAAKNITSPKYEPSFGGTPPEGTPTATPGAGATKDLEYWRSMVQKYIDEQKPVVGDEGLKHLLNIYENASGNRNDFTLTKGVPAVSESETVISEGEKVISEGEKVISEGEKVINYDANGAIAAAYQAQLDSLKRTKEYTEELVAAAREEAIRNAYAQYDKGKATYGRNAEQLAQMGLSNSGYGDYVEGKAYGAMVGGITDANVSADKAIRDAYYNYEQGKSKATAEYNASLEAAKKAYNDKYVGLLTAVEKGEIDAETAKKIAKAYNLDETHISEIATIADNYGTEKKEKAILYLNDAVKNGIADEYGNITYLTEDQIRNYGAENGLSEEEINPYISQNKENIDKVTVENFKQQITADTTYSDVDKLDVDDTIKSELKAYIDEKVYEKYANELKTEIDSGTVGLGNDTELDEKFAKGEISPETYQHIYYDRALAFADGIESFDEYDKAIKQIDGYVSQGKMSAENAEKAKDYIAKSIVKVIPRDAYKKGKTLTGDFYIEIDGRTIHLESKDTIDSSRKIYSEKRKQLLDKALEGNENAEMVVFNDGVYYKLDNMWYKFRNLAFLSGKNKIKEIAKTHTNTVSKPQFTFTK
jgi:hypothetical protein